ncbi:hypothetical protein RB195_013995 [Necator americanus]|uniref:Ig-like domain-containing protein n=1 Tax=Necator americanus TaxID=51031 RepID=A0ABR1DY51_NECAM
MEGTPQASANENPVPKERTHQIRLVQSNGAVNENGVSATRDEGDVSTTTLSTIAVRAGDHASIVVALLKSVGFIQLRIDEMKPSLLAIGGSSEEAASLLHIHEDLMARLKDKEDQVTALLTRAENLSSEKEAKEAVVYDDMAKCLKEAWHGLNKQLLLRGYLLRDTVSFYKLARRHEQLLNTVSEALKKIMARENGVDTALAARKIEQNVNELIETTAQAVDTGSSVISQIRTLGQLSDDPERAQEILASCVLIEKVMLRIASEWERVEATWKSEKSKIVIIENVDELLVIEDWLSHAERRVKAVTELGFKRLLEEGNAHKARLVALGASGAADGARITHLNGRIEEFLHYVKTRMNRSHRIQSFFQSAQTMLSQLAMMEADMRNANAAMAGELYPLAQQKASSVTHEGRDISAKEVLTYEEHALVKLRCQEIEHQLNILQQLANERQRGTQVSQELASLESWHTMRVVPFLATHTDMGGTLNEAVDFLEAHKMFVDEVVNRDASVVSAMAKRTEMTVVEQNGMRQFERGYEKLKDVLEHRIRIGNNFVQVHKFAKDLESSFDALTSLLDTNRDFTNERVAGQVDNVFHMIEETMTQEKHDVERFVNAAEAVAKGDETLNVTRSVQAAKNMIIDHDHRYTYLRAIWNEWQIHKAELKKKVTIIEEIEMWQEDTWEIIRLLENTTVTTLQESEGLHRRVKELGQTIDQQTAKLEEAKMFTDNEEYNRRLKRVLEKQEQIKERFKKLDKKVEVIYETFLQEEREERIRAPQILTALKDAQVDEGSRFEFVARIEGEPEPKITWLKDGIDVKNNIDYRQEYINGVASLVIEETFIEDTATYTVRAENAGGVAESSAKLTVKSRSAVSSLVEEEKPRFIKQLTNVQVTEGQTARLDCVVVGRPEPEVIWYKEEKTVKEDERIHLEFVGDHCSLTIKETEITDTGMYTARARNIHGEAINFCQLKVSPRKQPPPTAPKPTRPTIQTELATSTYEEGDTAILQIHTQGEPRPHVEWRFNEQPITTTETVTVDEKEDGWHRLIISPVTPAHTGVYTAVSVNEFGETRTSATLYVEPTTTTRTSIHEDMLQEDIYERMGRPTERTEEVVREESTQQIDEILEKAPVHSVDSVEQHEATRTVTSKEYAQQINEVPIPEVQKGTTTRFSETYAGQINEVPIPEVQKSTTTRLSSETFHAGQINEVPIPEVQKSTTTRFSETYAGQINEVPIPEVQKSTTTRLSSETFHAGQINEVPIPEVQKSTTTHFSETYAGQINEVPIPEVQKSTTTRFSEKYAGQISEVPIPEVQKSTTTRLSSETFHAGQINEVPIAEVQKSTTTRLSSETYHAGQINEVPIPEVQKSTTTRLSSETFHAGQINEVPIPEVQKSTTTRLSSETYHAGQINEVPIPEVQKSTTTRLSSETYHAGQINEVPIPDVEKSTTTRLSSETYHAGQIHKVPQPEVEESTTTKVSEIYHAGQILEAPRPEVEKTTTTKVSEIYHAGQILKAPQPEVEKTTTTKVFEVYHAGQILEAPRPEIEKTSTTKVSEVYHAGQILEAPQPKVETTTTTHITTEAYHAGAYYEAPQPEVQTTTKEKTEKMYQAAYYESSPQPEVQRTTKEKSEKMYQAARYESAPQPEVQRPTKTEKTEKMYQAIIPETPRAPDVEMATLTSEAVGKEHVAAIKQTPIPEVHKSTLSEALSVENIAAIRQSPAPETLRATLTQGVSFENIAAVRQPFTPEVLKAHLSRGISVENIGAVGQVAPEIHHSHLSRGASVEVVGAVRQPLTYEVHQAHLSRGVSVENIGAVRHAAAPEIQRSHLSRGASVETIGAVGQVAPEVHQAHLSRGASVEIVGAVRHAVAPEVYKSHLSRGVSVENIGIQRSHLSRGASVETIGAVGQVAPEIHHSHLSRGASVEIVGAVRHAVAPEVYKSHLSRGVSVENIGAIRQSPAPEAHKATVTAGSNIANIAAIRRTSMPDTHLAKITSAISLENIAAISRTPIPESYYARLTNTPLENVAAIRRTPAPEAGHATKIPGSAVGNIGTIRQTPAPETGYARTTAGSALENVGAIRRTPAPEAERATTIPGSAVGNIGTIRHTRAPETGYARKSPGTAVENIGAIRQTPAPETGYARTTAGSTVENIGAIRQTPAPERRRATTTSGTAVENIGAIRTTPAPETGFARKTSVSALENIGAIRQTPVPETGSATVTRSALENIGAIRRTPAPETGHATKIPGSAVENIGAIRQSEPVHPHTATKTDGAMKENVAQINPTTTQPDKREFTRSSLSIDRIDDIVVPERAPHTTAEVSQTVTAEGFIRHLDQDFTPTQVTTTERSVRGGVTMEQGERVRREAEAVVTVTEKTREQDAEERRQLEQLEQMEKEVEERLRRGPEVQKRVTQTTSAEGWVQRVEDDVAKPQVVQTTKRIEKEVTEDSRSKRHMVTPGETIVSTTKKDEEEEERRKIVQSRIPQRTTKVTTTTTADGFVQHLHDEISRPTEVTTKTRKEGEDAQFKRTVEMRRAEPTTEKTTTTTTTSLVQTAASRPLQPTTKTQKTTEEREEKERYRDSFIAASEGEGFWTDGAYTTSPSPPPIPSHLSRTYTEPQFIKSLHREYTVDEEGSITIECTLVGNPRPKVRFFLNDREIRKESKFVEIVTSGDTYSIVIKKARLEHAGYYKVVAENERGKTESLTMLHVRPLSLIQHQRRNGFTAPSQKITEYKTPTEHTTVTEEFAMFEYEQRRPQKHETSRLVTPPPAKRFQAHRKDEEMLEQYDINQRQPAGHPPHFTQTLVAAVAADGESARFDGIVTGWPAPTVEWTKDGEPFSRDSLPDVEISNIGGRVSLSFKSCHTVHSGKYMCTARNVSGVATSSAQLVVRPRTVAPDFIQRLISEEKVEGEQLKWTVRVTGDPLPKVTWLRDGIEIPDCEEVRIIDEGNGVHSLLIVRVELADSGQFTCLAENVAGEARSTADLVVRQSGSRPGSYFHITKVTQEKQTQGEQPVRNTAFTIENPPLQSAML